MTVPARVRLAQQGADRAGFTLSCEPAVGQLLAVLAAAVPPGGRILEMGTGAGVGTAWLTEGLAGRTDAAIVSVEVNPQVAAIARAGSWPPTVRLLVGDVLELLEGLGGFELIFADAQGGKWVGLDRTIAALRPGGLLVVDDMHPVAWMDEQHPQQTAKVRQTLLEHPAFTAVELRWASGVIIAAKRHR
jgi:demethylmenaquinone methyltransferase/2-methoxy-6-polyprenyl-1,4-benzoquinol methylase